MTKYYKSDFYDYPIEVENIDGEIIVSIIDSKGRKIIYSWYDIISKNTESKYITKGILGGILNGIPEKVLILGFGGGAYIKYLEDHFKNIDITGIDIDEAMYKIAKNELKVKTNNLIIDSAENAIKKFIKTSTQFNLILVDLYGNDGNIPKIFHKKGFYENLYKILSINGIISINYADYSGLNIGVFNKINFYLKQLSIKNHIQILCEKEGKGNICGIYNLNKKYDESEINMFYLKEVKKGNILYDPNMIKNTYIKK